MALRLEGRARTLSGIAPEPVGRCSHFPRRAYATVSADFARIAPEMLRPLRWTRTGPRERTYIA